MIIGYFLVARSEKLFEWFGENAFAEKYLGYGASRFFYKLIGIIVVFIGIFMVTNVASDILRSLVGFLTNT